MRKYFKALWTNDRAALLSAEWVFMATILVIGVTVGLVSVRDAVDTELGETANAITHLDQSYTFSGIGNTQPLGSSGSVNAAGSGAVNNPGNAAASTLRLYRPLHDPNASPVDEHLID